MKVKLIGHTWGVCTEKEVNFCNLPNTGAVYVLTIISNVFKRRKIVYIGSTNCIRRRMLSHTVFSVLTYNKSNYKVEILYKNCGDKENRLIESYLIKKFVPPYNGHFKKDQKYTKWNLWNDLKIKKVIIIKLRYKFTTVDINEYLK